MPRSSQQKPSAPPVSPAAETSTPPGSPLRFVCIHGHFYQPPRENPWLETVEIQDSAAPYHDWNDRITAECYAPNGASRITDLEDRIIRIVNNYGHMSFNFGPTLLSWLADKAPRTYRMILAADTASQGRFSGHGSAMAQVYNHIIMPLASPRDALTQIRWGIADFVYRFQRRPEGMWLAETAVNRSVLDLLAREGILFTVLAPSQCARVRRLATAPPAQKPGAKGQPAVAELPWTETPDATVDPTQPYLVQLDEGRSIAVFFYDGPNSRAIAFEGLLNSGETFARRLLGGFQPGPADQAQLSHVATDGESYGHHHKHGEMALSYAMHWIEENHLAKLTNYGEFLAKFPPRWEAEVAEDTSWSCVHGVERWRSNCGCNGGKPGWSQMWRAPLREALDLLRDRTAPLAEKLAEGLLKDLWAARDAYIDVMLDRNRTDHFFAAHATHPLSAEERVTVLDLMELERHTQLMYTSCGWFFDDISGIETVQIIAYAGRVLQLAARLFCDTTRFGKAGIDLEPEFLAILANAKSNVPEMGDGAQVYRRYVASMKIGLEQVGAHYAISSVFRNYPEDGQLFCFDVHRDSHEVFSSGRGKVALGRARVRSRITEETEEIAFAVLHLGDQNLSAAVRRYTPADEEAFSGFSNDVRQAIRRANLPEVIRLIDRYFDPRREDGSSHPAEAAPAVESAASAADTNPPHSPTAYSLSSLFADEQQRILKTILNQTMSEMEDSLRKIYEDHASLLDFLTEAGMAAPPALALAANFAINASLRRALEADTFDAEEIRSLVARADREQIPLDNALLSFAAGQCMKRAMVRLETEQAQLAATNRMSIAGDTQDATDHDPYSADLSTIATALIALNSALLIAEVLSTMPFEVNLWQAQNIWNDLLRRSNSAQWSPIWRDTFKRLGHALNIDVDRLVTEEGVAAF